MTIRPLDHLHPDCATRRNATVGNYSAANVGRINPTVWEFEMKSAVVTILSLLLSSLQAKAQPAELTLNCAYESSYDIKSSLTEKTSGSFSATVRMQTLKGGTQTATIHATTVGCFDFDGSFDELEVYGDCERTVGSSEFKANMRINRISGEFSNMQTFGKSSALIFSGHCTPRKKLF
jgi:hypothetical protein